jgi:hypothetical protein
LAPPSFPSTTQGRQTQWCHSSLARW